MTDDVEECPECLPGIPAWMATFADLMSLLMCFFVLLLSFSEMDLLKYKQLAGSMNNAFGVQNKIKVRDIPKGTSIIAQEFSPGKPQSTPIHEIRQSTTDFTKNTLDFKLDDTGTNESGEDVGHKEVKAVDSISQKEIEIEQEKEKAIAKINALIKETEGDARILADQLKEEISEGKIDVETRGRDIIIRIREKGSFPSGSADLSDQFISVMAAVQDQLKNIDGQISIEGHTDSVPITTNTFKSNWDLSSARALSVAHELFKGAVLDTNRFIISGFAATKPLSNNNSKENRARNRRVEIIIKQPLDAEGSKDVKYLQQLEPNYFKELNFETDFILSPDEIF